MSDDRPQRTTYEQNSPYVTSDANQQQRLTAGLGVVEGFEITAPASEGGLTAEIAAGVAWMGETVAVSSATVSFESDDSDPRKIVIYVDGAGDVEVAQGDPAPPKPAGKSGRLTYQPVAPPLDGVEAVVLWEGYIAPGATAASEEMFDDRRDESRISVHAVEAERASVEDAPEASTDVARKQETDALDDAKADTPHDLGGTDHTADTLANLNSKVSDATLDDANDARTPEAHSGTHESGGSDVINVAGLSGELANPQPSQTQDNGTDVVVSSTLNFGTALDVTDDDGVARIDNAEPGENIPNWVEDGNSPHNFAVDGGTYTLVGEYDEVMVRYFGNQTGSERLRLRINGDTGSNYDRITVDNQSFENNDEIDLFSLSEDIRGGFVISGRWQSNCILMVDQRATFGIGILQAQNDSVTSPLQTLDFRQDDETEASFDCDIEVYGREIA